MTVKEALSAVSAYPISDSAISNIADERDLVLADEVTPELRNDNKFKLAVADAQTWVSQAPDISEADVKISLTKEQKEDLKERANNVYKELGDSKYKPYQVFSYQGEDV